MVESIGLPVDSDTSRKVISDGKHQWGEFEGVDILSMLHMHVFCAYRTVLGSEWCFQDATDNKTRLYYVVAGRGEMACGGQRVLLQPGHLCLVPPNAARTYRCLEPLDLFWCHFSIRLHSGVDFYHDVPAPLDLIPANTQKVHGLFEEMAMDFSDDDAGTILARSGILLQLIAPFCGAIDALALQRRGAAVEPFGQVLALIESRYREHIEIRELAALVHMAPAAFSRRFSQVFGVPPSRYILRRRIEEAQMRLLETNDTLAHIGVELGFCDGFHFARAFKKLTGLPPGRYRELVLHP